MKRIICFVLVLVLCLSFASCGDSGESASKKKLTVYVTEDEASWYEGVIKHYNSYCISGTDNKLGVSYQIEPVKFKTADEMYKKMTTEIMAGGGPDLFFTYQNIPFEKMVYADSFADVDELLSEQKADIDFSGYNRNVMDSGVWNGKRYIVPFLYNARVLFTNQKTAEKYKLPKHQGDVLTYADKSQIGKFFDDKVVPRLFYDYVDFKNKEFEFDTKEFQTNLDTIKDYYIAGQESDQEEEINMYSYYTDDGTREIFDTSAFNFYEAAFVYCTAFNKKLDSRVYNKEVADNIIVLSGINRYAGKLQGSVTLGAAVNKNTKKRKEACEYIRFMLSDMGQRKISNPYYGNALDGFPVLNSVFEKRVEENAEIDDASYHTFKTDCPFMKKYYELVRSVEVCDLYSGTSYYFNNVVRELLEKYVKGELTKKKLVRQLTTATKFYLEE